MDFDSFIENVVRQSRQHRTFYHFTDTRNLQSIQEHGLLSLANLQARGIQPLAPGGNQLSHDEDRRRGLDTYVHLCFMNEHPMEYRARQDGRINQSKFLKIDPSIIKHPGVLIADDVANTAGVFAQPAAEMLDEIDLEVIYQRTEWKNPAVMERVQAARRYELLVPDQVILDYLCG